MKERKRADHISRFQRNTETVKDLNLVSPKSEEYEEDKDNPIIFTYKNSEKPELHVTRQTKVHSFFNILTKENSFLDIDLFLDAIGGSRANGFFITPFGYKNTGRREFNNITSLAHKKTLCVYGESTFDFSSALSDVCVFNNNRDYIVHSVSFSEHMHDFVHNEINPSISQTRRVSKLPRYNFRQLRYDRGMSYYFKRLQQFRVAVNEEIEKYGELVSNGRRAKIIFLFFTPEEFTSLQENEEDYANFLDIFYTGHKERIYLIPCLKELKVFPRKLIDDADMIMAYGEDNSELLKKFKLSTFDYELEKEYNGLKTVGTVFDRIYSPGLFPLDGLTEEFFTVKKTLEKWEKKEDRDYIRFLNSLDDGSKYDDFQDHQEFNRQVFAQVKDKKDIEEKRMSRYKPVIEFI